MERVAKRIIEYAPYLYHKPWEWWELLALGLVVLSLLMMIVGTRQRARIRREAQPGGPLRNFRDL